MTFTRFGAPYDLPSFPLSTSSHCDPCEWFMVGIGIAVEIEKKIGLGSRSTSSSSRLFWSTATVCRGCLDTRGLFCSTVLGCLILGD